MKWLHITYMQAVSNINQCGQNHVCGKERLGQSDTTDGGVIQGALKPLIRMRVGSILREKGGLAIEYVEMHRTKDMHALDG